jgi:hypothetical protein
MEDEYRVSNTLLSVYDIRVLMGNSASLGVLFVVTFSVGGRTAFFLGDTDIIFYPCSRISMTRHIYAFESI